MSKVKRILVPVDFSEPSGIALDYAIDLTRELPCEILVLHVCEPLRFVELELTQHDVDLIADIARSGALQRAAEFVADHDPIGLSPIKCQVAFGVPHTTIVDVADSEDFDLIVMGTHGRSGVRRFFLGSVAEKVIRHAPCPVLTIRTQRPSGHRSTSESLSAG